jgi:hypothetical protein
MDEDDPLVALRNVRSRFIAGFHGQCDSLEALIVAGAPGDAPTRDAARQLVHRVVGLAGTIGFKSLSTRAAARGPISAGPATIALVRVPAGPQQAAALEAFRFEVRRRDVIGRYNHTHLVLLLPGMTAGAARRPGARHAQVDD